MTNKFYELMIAHPGQSKVHKIYISYSLLYTLATAGFIGLITLAIFLASFTRMSVKVAEFNKLRPELEDLKGDQQSHLTVASQLVERIVFLELLGQKLSLAAGLAKTSGKFEGWRLWEAPPRPSDSSDELADNPSNGHLQLMGEGLNQLQDRFLRIERYFQNKYFRLAHIPSMWPVSGLLSGGFGTRQSFSNTGELSYHAGIDISSSLGSPILAPAHGTVLCTERRTGYGNLVVVDHGFGISTRFAHLSAFSVKPGQKVTRGEILGFVGMTGRSTGPHLHYEVRLHGEPVNPLRHIFKSS